MKQSINMHKQQGATLIVVLLVLLLIMIAGAMAVRQSRTDLQVATSDQINTVLLQTADNANQKLEQIINGSTSDTAYYNLVEHPSGFIGYFYNNKDRKNRANDEVVYCQTKDEQEYLVSGATVRRGSGSIYNKGYCAQGSKLRYTSDRGTMVGQVSISPSADNVSNDDDNILGSYVTGQNTLGTSAQRIRFDIYSTAAIPAYSNGDQAVGCFNNRTSKPTKNGDGTQNYNGTVSHCLEQANIPQTSVYQQADISRYTTAKACKGFGMAEGDVATSSNDTTQTVCQLQ